MTETTADPQMILCGFIKGAHGVRGLVKVESLSDNPARFAAGSILEVQLPQKPPQSLSVETASAHKGQLLVQFAGVNSKEAADRLRGAKLMASVASSAPLAAGQFYHYQLIGLRVLENGLDLGQIVEILDRPANDLYVLQTPEGQEVLIPALKQIIKRIDLEQKLMEVELPAGLKPD